MVQVNRDVLSRTQIDGGEPEGITIPEVFNRTHEDWQRVGEAIDTIAESEEFHNDAQLFIMLRDKMPDEQDYVIGLIMIGQRMAQQEMHRRQMNPMARLAELLGRAEQE